MSLISFHRILIGAAIAFCGVYALWELRQFVQQGGLRPLLLAIGFAAAAVGLGYYLRHLGRILRLPRTGAGSTPPHR